MKLKKDDLLLNTLIAIFWVVSLFGFFRDELIPSLSNVETYFFAAVDGVVLFLGVATIKRRIHLLLVGLFLALAFVTTMIINGLGLIFFLNGLRDFVGLLFMPVVYYWIWSKETCRKRFINRFDKHLTLWLIIQFPCIVWQFAHWGACDKVGGSLGNFMSGLDSTLIYMVSFYLLRKRLKNYQNIWQGVLDNIWLVLLVLPTFLNETKVSFIYLIMYFLLLLPIDRKIFVRSLVIFPVLSLMIYVGWGMYMSSQSSFGYNFFSSENLVEYIYVDDVDEVESNAKYAENYESSGSDVPRVTKLVFFFLFENDYPGCTLHGMGLAQFKGGTTLEPTKFFNENEWVLTGTIPFFYSIAVQLGLLGVAWYVLFLVFTFTKSPFKKNIHDWNLQFYVIAVFLILLVYSDMQRIVTFNIFVFYIIACSWKEPLENSEDANEPNDDEIIAVGDNSVVGLTNKTIDKANPQK